MTDATDHALLPAMRKLLLGLVALVMVGTVMDLLLLEHYEEAWQWVPLVVLAVALGVAPWTALTGSARAVLIFRIVMLLVVCTGLLGVAMHYNGSREFQIEMDPALAGWALFVKAMRAKAPPTLAPAAMIQAGLLGLLYTWRHPALAVPSNGVLR